MSTTDRAPTANTGSSCSPDVMERAWRLIGDKVTLMIVYNLMPGARRFGELLESLDGVSPKTVSHRLKMLEEIEFVQRQAFAEIPPRVEYRLTAKGSALAGIIEAIVAFAEQHLTDSPPAEQHQHAQLRPLPQAPFRTR